MDTELVFDVDEGAFETAVIERSHEVPVVVDFWASWCGPCRTLGPMLEDRVAARGGDVLLAKLDVDANPNLSARYGIRGIPAVKAFREGEVVAEFTGAVPRTHVEAFLDQVVPSEADRLVEQAAAQEAPELYQRALELEPDNRRAALGLARHVVDDDPERALQLVKAHRPHPDAEAVATRAELQLAGGGDVEELRRHVSQEPRDGEAHLLLGRALAAQGDYGEAVAHLLEAVRLGGESREPAREQTLALFTVLGDDHELVRRYRPELAKALF